MRILTWNIMHGGGRQRLPHILMAMLDLEPDVIVVTEARRRFAGQLAAALADAGLPHSLDTNPPDNVNGVLLIANTPLLRVNRGGMPACLRHRWLEADLPEAGLAVAGVHLAEAAKTHEHSLGWRALLRVARVRRDDRFVIAGDLNTWRTPGRSRSGAAATNLGRLRGLGYADAWAESHPDRPGATWSDHAGRSFRLDYAMLSSPLAGGLRAAEIAYRTRALGLSDHAALYVELVPDEAESGARGPKTPMKRGENGPQKAESPKKTGVESPTPLASQMESK